MSAVSSSPMFSGLTSPLPPPPPIPPPLHSSPTSLPLGQPAISPDSEYASRSADGSDEADTPEASLSPVPFSGVPQLQDVTAQLQKLNQRVNALSERLDGIDERFSETDKRIDSLKSETDEKIAALQTGVDLRFQRLLGVAAAHVVQSGTFREEVISNVSKLEKEVKGHIAAIVAHIQALRAERTEMASRLNELKTTKRKLLAESAANVDAAAKRRRLRSKANASNPDSAATAAAAASPAVVPDQTATAHSPENISPPPGIRVPPWLMPPHSEPPYLEKDI